MDVYHNKPEISVLLIHINQETLVKVVKYWKLLILKLNLESEM